MGKIILFFLTSLLFNFSVLAQDAKKNRDKYNNYFSSRYNEIIRTVNGLGGIEYYLINKKIGPAPLDNFPKFKDYNDSEGKKFGIIWNKYLPKIRSLGQRHQALMDIMNSITAKWTMEHLNELKVLIGEINKLWNEFGGELNQAFPASSKGSQERVVMDFKEKLSNWKTKSIQELDME